MEAYLFLLFPLRVSLEAFIQVLPGLLKLGLGLGAKIDGGESIDEWEKRRNEVSSILRATRGHRETKNNMFLALGDGQGSFRAGARLVSHLFQAMSGSLLASTEFYEQIETGSRVGL